MKEKTELQQLCEDAADDGRYGGRQMRVRSYSGRGMFGASCLGVEGDSLVEIFAALFQAAADQGPDLQEIADALADGRTDSMGRGVILYFPQIGFVDEEEEELEEDCPESAACP